jgi:Amt family ammonium transporter
MIAGSAPFDSDLFILRTPPQLGFFYGGLVESTTVLNTLMMSFICAALITLQWILYGYTLVRPGDTFFLD